MKPCFIVLTVVSLTVVVLAGVGCGPTYVRGSEVEGLDDYAMSTGLDKRDLEKLFDQNIKSFMESNVVTKWKELPEPPVLSLFPIANETSEHVRESLDTLLSMMETTIINNGVALVVDGAKQSQLIEEVKRQQGGAFNEAQSAQVGRQLGAKYFLTGKVYDTSERAEGERRVQYFLFMQLVDVETSAVRWQNKAELTKGLVN